MTDSTLLDQVDQAFNDGREKQGLDLLREHNKSNTNDAASWHRQAVIEEQIGDWSAAGQAHYRCIEIAPINAIGYLYAGYWLQKTSREEASAALYSLAQDADPSSLTLANRNSVSEPTRLRSEQGNHLMRRVLSQHHRKAVSKLPNSDRISNAKWVRSHDNILEFDVKNFSPELFYIPDITTQPYYDASDFKWTKSIFDKTNAIKEELSHAMSQQLTQDNLRPYLDENFATHSDLNMLANSSDWLAMDLYKNGELNSDIAGFFPQTLAVIDSLPTYSLGESPFEVFFSFLKPRQSIAPHHGQSNHALTVHLPLDIPLNCYLSVDKEQRKWNEGELLIFDDSFLHSAHNNGDQTRVVLIFSVWHPDLNDDERNAVKLSFQERQQWSLQRRSCLQELLKT